MKICENGVAKCSIHVPAKPTEAELHAAKELAKYLKKMSGASFKIARGIPDSGPAVIVSDLAHTSFAGTRRMAPESILRLTDGGRLFLVGADPRGTLIGVYDFLRDELGCVFPQQRASDEYIPKKPTIEVSGSEYYHEPFLPWRYFVGGGRLQMLDWAAKVGMSCGGPPCVESFTMDWSGE